MYLDIEQLGRVRLIPNPRAKRIIIRFRDEEFQLTHPPGAAISEIRELLMQKRGSLLELKDNSPADFHFTEETKFSTHSFDVVIVKNNLNAVCATLEDGVLQISYPQKVSLQDADVQYYIKSMIEEMCRAEAKRILPARVSELARRHGFIFSDVKINKSRSRWGSCSSLKNINLSYYCMMLPPELIDLVILHELCHTREMNHSECFWAQLRKVTEGRSDELTRQLKDFRLKW